NNGNIVRPISKSGTGGWLHSGRIDRGIKQKGKLAEILVYNTLVNELGVENVKWVSGNSNTPDKNDMLHYDIEYKNTKGEWKFLDVKSISEKQDIITKEEVKKGIESHDKYDIALIQNHDIKVVEDILNFNDGETVEQNCRYDPI